MQRYITEEDIEVMFIWFIKRHQHRLVLGEESSSVSLNCEAITMTLLERLCPLVQ